MTVTTSSLLHEASRVVKGILTSGMTDPISATRPAKDKFVIDDYADRETTYPHVTVVVSDDSRPRITMGSGLKDVTLEFDCMVWSKSTKQRDEVYDNMMNVLNNSIGSFNVEGLTGPIYLGHILDTGDARGKEGVHIRGQTIGVRYAYI